MKSHKHEEVLKSHQILELFYSSILDRDSHGGIVAAPHGTGKLAVLKECLNKREMLPELIEIDTPIQSDGYLEAVKFAKEGKVAVINIANTKYLDETLLESIRDMSQNAKGKLVIMLSCSSVEAIAAISLLSQYGMGKSIDLNKTPVPSPSSKESQIKSKAAPKS